jgi:hypothetical protein
VSLSLGAASICGVSPLELIDPVLVGSSATTPASLPVVRTGRSPQARERSEDRTAHRPWSEPELSENPDMKLVNRTAVILWPQQPLVTWIKRREPGCGMTLERVRDEPTLYLLDTYAADNLDELP